MTHATSLPPDLHQWVTRHIVGMDTAAVTDASWPRGDSRVWHVRADHGEVFVKLYPSAEKYEREVKGCEHATRALAVDATPRLLASDPQRPAVVLSTLPDRVVRGLPLEADARSVVAGHSANGAASTPSANSTSSRGPPHSVGLAEERASWRSAKQPTSFCGPLQPRPQIPCWLCRAGWRQPRWAPPWQC
ncbi:hypothetical protein SHO565_74310 [Streptomyces sp. HO565]